MSSTEITEDRLEDNLKDTFDSQASWRREKAKEYPDDARNTEAVEIFDRLAATVCQIKPEIMARLDGAIGGSDPSYNNNERFSEMLRQVGFVTSYDTAEEFVRAFLVKADEDDDPGFIEQTGLEAYSQKQIETMVFDLIEKHFDEPARELACVWLSGLIRDGRLLPASIMGHEPAAGEEGGAP